MLLACSTHRPESCGSEPDRRTQCLTRPLLPRSQIPRLSLGARMSDVGLLVHQPTTYATSERKACRLSAVVQSLCHRIITVGQSEAQKGSHGVNGQHKFLARMLRGSYLHFGSRVCRIPKSIYPALCLRGSDMSPESRYPRPKPKGASPGIRCGESFHFLSLFAE